MEKRIKYGSTLLFFLIAGLALYGYFYHISGTSPEFLNKEPDIHVSARDLIGISNNNESLFNHQYLYRILSVRGIVKDLRRNETGAYVLRLGANPDLPTLFVNCTLDSMYSHRELSLKTGDSCTIQGTCAGQLMNVILVQCIIQD